MMDAMHFAEISKGLAHIIKGFYTPVNNFLIRLPKNCAPGDGETKVNTVRGTLG